MYWFGNYILTFDYHQNKCILQNIKRVNTILDLVTNKTTYKYDKYTFSSIVLRQVDKKLKYVPTLIPLALIYKAQHKIRLFGYLFYVIDGSLYVYLYKDGKYFNYCHNIINHIVDSENYDDKNIIYELY